MWRAFAPAALALVALVPLVAPLALGGPAERAYRGLIDRLVDTLPPGWMALTRYSRGWFASRAEVELTGGAPAPGAAPLRVRLTSRIDHGPLAWLSPDLGPAPARAHTRIALADPALDLPALEVDTRLRADGAALARLHLPAGTHTGRTRSYGLHNGELQGTLSAEPGGRRLRLDLTLPELVLAGPAGPVASLAGLALQADLTGWIGPLYTGSVRLDVESATLGPSAAPGAEPQGPEAATDRDPEAGAAANPGPGGPAALQGLTLTLDQQPSEGLLDARLTVAATAATLAGRTYRDARLGLAVERLEGEALAELLEGMRTIAAQAPAGPLRDLAAATLFARLWPRLAAATPRLALDPVHAETPAGPVDARLSLGIARGPNPPAGSAGPTTLPGVLAEPRGLPGLAGSLPSLTGEGGLLVPEALARAWLGADIPPAGIATGPGAGPDARTVPEGTAGSPPGHRPDSAADQAAAAAAGRPADRTPGPPDPAAADGDPLARWIAAGWISRRDGHLATDFQLANGLLTVNGLPLPLLAAPLGLGP